MVIIGALMLVVFVASGLVLSAIMLSGRISESEQSRLVLPPLQDSGARKGAAPHRATL